MQRIIHVCRLAAINAVVLAVLAVAVLAATEAYLRFTIPAPEGGSIFEYTADTRLYKRYRKDSRVSAYGVEFRTNELGFRDDRSDVPVKREDEFRIIILGDSFTTSAGVPYERIFSSLLGQRLVAGTRQVRVLNLGVGGYNIIQYEILLREVGLGLDPDLVLVAVFPFNDFDNTDYAAQRARATGQAATAAQPATQPSRAPYRSWYIYRAFLWKIAWRLKALFQPDRPDGQHSREQREQHIRRLESDRQENLQALGNIIDLTARQGIPAAIVGLPNTDTPEPQQDDFGLLADFCAQHRVPCLDLLESFTADGVNPRALRLNAIDAHPDERYHELAANYLVPFLQQFIP